MRKRDRRDNQKSAAAEAAAAPSAMKMILAWATLVWAVFVVIKFDQKFSLSPGASFDFLGDLLSVSPRCYLNVLVPYFKSLFLLVVLMAGMAGWGSFLLGAALSAQLTPLERWLISGGLGAIVCSFIVFGAGLVGGYGRVLLGVVFATFAGGGLLLSWRRLIQWGREARPFLAKTLVASPVHVLVGFFCLLAFLMAFVPEIFYDSLVYHLGLPQFFVNEGRIVDTPHVYFSRFPMLMHMLYVVGVGLDGSNLAKLLNWSALMMGLGSLVAVCRRMGWSRTAVWAACFVVSAPLLQMNVWSTAVDAALASFSVLGLLAFLIWWQMGCASRRLFLIASFLVGAAFATKYTGVCVVIAFGIALFLFRRDGGYFRFLTENILLFGLAVFVVMSPWLVRNYAWTGNPTYPILSSRMESRHLNSKKIEPEMALASRSRPESFVDLLRFPWRKTMEDLSSFNFIGPMTLAGLPLVLFVPWRKNRDSRILGVVLTAFLAVALKFSGDIRYSMTGLAFLSVFLAGGLSHAAAVPVLAWILRAAFFCFGLYHLGWVLQTAQSSYRPAEVLLGKESRGHYTGRYHPGLNPWPSDNIHPTLEKLPASARGYILGVEMVFGTPCRFWYSSSHDDTPLVLWANESRSPDEFFENLRNRGFTHLLLNVPETMRLLGNDPLPWTDQGRRNFIGWGKNHLQLAEAKSVDGFPNALFLFEILMTKDRPDPYGSFDGFFGEVLNLRANGKK